MASGYAELPPDATLGFPRLSKPYTEQQLSVALDLASREKPVGAAKVYIICAHDAAAPGPAPRRMGYAGQAWPPPSTRSTCPETNAPSGPANTSTTRATSSTVAIRSSVPVSTILF